VATGRLLTVTAVALLCACASASHSTHGSHPGAPAPPPLSKAGCIPGSTDSYPEEARSQGLYGVTTVAFAIDQKGLAADPKVLASDSKYFAAASLQMLKHMQCKPTETPVDLVLQRHTADIQFLIYPPCKALPKSAQAEDVLFVVCGSVLMGTHPVRAHGD
jgi:outer membrane biosynthesis protein TonB